MTGPFEAQVDKLCPLVETPWGWGAVKTVLNEAVASVAVPKTSMSGKLQLSSSGWALLSVPNQFVKGVYSTLRDTEPDIELPVSRKHGSGRLNAHISVASSDELKTIPNGPTVIRQHSGDKFRYQIGELKTVAPASTSEFKKVWYVSVKSPELEDFRSSIGLSRRPNKNKFEFHITVGAVFR